MAGQATSRSTGSSTSGISRTLKPRLDAALGGLMTNIERPRANEQLVTGDVGLRIRRIAGAVGTLLPLERTTRPSQPTSRFFCSVVHLTVSLVEGVARSIRS